MTVEEMLRSLGAQDKGQVSPQVDAAVMAEWDEWGRESSKNDPRPHFAALALAALVVFAVTLFWWVMNRPVENRPVSAVPRNTFVPAAPAPAAIAATPDTRPIVEAAPQVVRRSPPARPQAPEVERTGSAIVLVPDIESSGPLTVMRIRMARREFSRLGVPITNPDGDGLVDVEVLVGEDGVARSIRRAVAVGWTGPTP